MPKLIHWNNEAKKDDYIKKIISDSCHRGVLFLVPTLRALEKWKKHFPDANILETGLSKSEFLKRFLERSPLNLATPVGLFYSPAFYEVVIVEDEDDSGYESRMKPSLLPHEVLPLWKKEIYFFSRSPLVSTFQASEYIPLLEENNVSVNIIDMNQEPPASRWFSHSLLQMIEQKKAFLFFHRRGNSRFNICRSCGEMFPPAPWCPQCSSPDIKEIMPGVIGLAEKLRKIFPNKKIVALQKGEKLPPSFDIVFGTVYALDVLDPRTFDVIGVVSLDTLLVAPFPHVPERIYGIASRLLAYQKPLFVQTFAPDHPLLQASFQENYLSIVKIYEDFNRKKPSRSPKDS